MADKKQDAVVEIGLFDSLLERINAVPEVQLEGQVVHLQIGETQIGELSIEELKLHKLVSDLGDKARQIQTEIREKTLTHTTLHTNPEYEGEHCESDHAEIERLTKVFYQMYGEYDALRNISWALLRLKYPGQGGLKIEGRCLVAVEKKEGGSENTPSELQSLFGGGGSGGLGQLLGLLLRGRR